MPRKYVEVDGFAVNYFHTGRTTLPTVPPDLTRGRLMVYVHGAGGNGEYGRKFLEVLAEDHSPLALDFPGHGRSGGTESLGSVPEYGDFLDAFVRTLGLRPVVLVGHSMGGAVAIDFTLRHPEAVDALVLVATAARFAVSPQRLDLWRDVMRGRRQQPFTREAFSAATPESVVREGWAEQVKTDPRVRYSDLLACSRFDGAARLAEIRKPALVVCGRDDVMTPPALSEEIRDGIPGARLEVIADAGHALPLEKPQELGGAVRRFLSG